MGSKIEKAFIFKQKIIIIINIINLILYFKNFNMLNMIQLKNHLYKHNLIISLILFLLLPLNLNAEINILSWGGTYQEMQKEKLGDQFYKSTGIKVNWVNWRDYPFLKLNDILEYKNTNLPQIDIIDTYIGFKNKLNDLNNKCDQEEIYNFNKTNNLSSNSKNILHLDDYIVLPQNDCLFGNFLFSWNYAYNINLFGNQKPLNAKDFFNTKKFPGKRGIYINPKPNVELSLLADGVSSGGLYKVIKNQTSALSRAIKKIDNLCNDPNGGCVFWVSGQEPIDLLIDGKVIMTTGWANRFSKSEVNDNSPFKQVFEGQIIDYEYYIINNDIENKEKIFKFLKFVTLPENEIKFLEKIPYASWRKSTLININNLINGYDETSQKILNNIPIKSDNYKKQVFIDHLFWEQNYNEISKIWQKEILDKYN